MMDGADSKRVAPRISQTYRAEDSTPFCSHKARRLMQEWMGGRRMKRMSIPRGAVDCLARSTFHGGETRRFVNIRVLAEHEIVISLNT